MGRALRLCGNCHHLVVALAALSVGPDRTRNPSAVRREAIESVFHALFLAA